MPRLSKAAGYYKGIHFDECRSEWISFYVSLWSANNYGLKFVLFCIIFNTNIRSVFRWQEVYDV